MGGSSNRFCSEADFTRRADYIFCVRLKVKVPIPPAKPLMIYDGDCDFCGRWIVRWQRETNSHVDYLPAQDRRVADQFPQLTREQLEAAVHLVTTDGSVFAGAEAVIRSLALASRARWLLRCYERSQTFARLADWSYRFVARHRQFFSAVS